MRYFTAKKDIILTAFLEDNATSAVQDLISNKNKEIVENFNENIVNMDSLTPEELQREYDSAWDAMIVNDVSFICYANPQRALVENWEISNDSQANSIATGKVDFLKTGTLKAKTTDEQRIAQVVSIQEEHSYCLRNKS